MSGTKYSEKNPNQNALASQDKVVNNSHRHHPRIFEYLASRGVDVNDNDLPDDLRYHKGIPYYNGDDGGSTFYPTLVSIYRTTERVIRGIHKTHLSPKDKGKADVETPKKFGKALWPGASNGAALHLDPAVEEMAFAEGLETGMAVRQATGLATWVGGSAAGLRNMVIPSCVKSLTIWADNDTNQTGQKAAETLAQRASKQGVDVYILVPGKDEDDPGKGRDFLDVFVENGPEALRQAYDAAELYVPGNDSEDGQDAENDELIEFIFKFNKDHFVVNVGGKTMIAQETFEPISGFKCIRLSRPADVRLQYQNIYIGDDLAVDLWLSSLDRRSYNNIVFYPGGHLQDCYNLFQGFAVNPVPGDCSLYWAHVQEVICCGNEEIYRFVRRWLAHIIQKPGELPGTALVLRGEQGTGKGMFVEPICALLGKHSFTAYNLKHLVGNFNAHLAECLLVHANEAIWGGNKKEEGVLKGIITDPTTPIEQKGVDVMQMHNFKRLIASSNENWCIPMDMDDRRFLVCNISNKYKENHEYFSKLHQQMENGGLEALMHDLLHENLEGFNVRKLPRSEYNFDLKLKGASPIYLWWYDCLCEKENCSTISAMANGSVVTYHEWKGTVSSKDLHSFYAMWCKENRKTAEPASVFGKYFSNFFPNHVLKKTRPKKEGSTSTRQYCIVLPDIQDCRKAFEQITKSGPEIWPDEDFDDVDSVVIDNGPAVQETPY
jgi:hypothetical protein